MVSELFAEVIKPYFCIRFSDRIVFFPFLIPHRPACLGGAFLRVLGRLADALVPELHQLLQPLSLHLGHGAGLLVHLAHALEGLQAAS